MPVKYVAYNWLGKRVQGVLDTDSVADAYDTLQQDQLLPYRVEPQKVRRTLVQRMPALFTPKTQDIIDFTRQVGSLVKAGVPLRRALIVQRDATRSAGLKDALNQVVQDVEAGNRFSDACAKHPTVFPDLYVRLVRIGEATGGLAGVFEVLTQTLGRRKAVRDRVRSALTYPLISLVVAMIAGFVLVTYSLPSLTGMLEEFGGQLPFATKLLIAASDFLEARGLLLTVGVLSTAIGGLAFLRTRLGMGISARVLLKLPLAGHVSIQSNMFFLTTNLTALLRGGLSSMESLRLASASLENVYLRERLAEVARLASEGTRLGEAFSQEPALPSVLSQAVTAGDSRGLLSDTVGGLADYYEVEAERAISWATELIQPAIILLLSGLVGFVAVAIVSGIYSTLGSVR